MIYRILSLGDTEGEPMERHPPHIFSATDDKAAEAHARKVWEQWFADGDWPNEDGQAMRVAGSARVDGPWFNAECTSPGPDCGEWSVTCHGETAADHRQLQRLAGVDTDCVHHWVIRDPDGFNGVRGGSGTETHHTDYCAKCGCKRVLTLRGSNRNPGQASEHWSYDAEP